MQRNGPARGRFRSGAGWDAPWRAQVAAGVSNAFGADPPISFSTFAGNFDPGYELPGRFRYVRDRQAF